MMVRGNLQQPLGPAHVKGLLGCRKDTMTKQPYPTTVDEAEQRFAAWFAQRYGNDGAWAHVRARCIMLGVPALDRPPETIAGWRDLARALRDAQARHAARPADDELREAFHRAWIEE